MFQKFAIYQFVCVLLLFTPSCVSYKCGQCICRPWQNVVSCTGENVSQIPYLPDTRWVKHVDILNTRINSTDGFKFWNQLVSIELRDNTFLQCYEIYNLGQKFPNITLLTDCDDNATNIEPRTPNHCPPTDGVTNYWWSALFILPFILIILVWIYTRTNARGPSTLSMPQFPTK